MGHLPHCLWHVSFPCDSLLLWEIIIAQAKLFFVLFLFESSPSSLLVLVCFQQAKVSSSAPRKVAKEVASDGTKAVADRPKDMVGCCVCLEMASKILIL